MSEVLSLAGSLVLIILILVLTWYATRWYARRAGQQGYSGKYIKVIDRSPVGTGASVAIVEVDGRYYMVGIGDKSVSLLCELPDFQVPPDDPAAAATPFSQVFRQVLDKAKGSAGKDGDHRP